jgi:hypothetical protein
MIGNLPSLIHSSGLRTSFGFSGLVSSEHYHALGYNKSLASFLAFK